MHPAMYYETAKKTQERLSLILVIDNISPASNLGGNTQFQQVPTHTSAHKNEVEKK